MINTIVRKQIKLAVLEMEMIDDISNRLDDLDMLQDLMEQSGKTEQELIDTLFWDIASLQSNLTNISLKLMRKL